MGHPSEKAMPYLKRMELDSPKSIDERLLRREVMYALKLAKKI
jgi:hypothetical protein